VLEMFHAGPESDLSYHRPAWLTGALYMHSKAVELQTDYRRANDAGIDEQKANILV